MSDCARCGGTGRQYIDDIHVRECVCAYANRLRTHLGPELAGAPVPKAPRLCPRDESGKTVKEDHTKKNLLIRGAWPDVRSHLKYALAWKGPDFPFVVVTDERIRSVYLGNEAYIAKARTERDDAENNNSLRDLLGSQHALGIVRVGFLGYANRAAPGALQEALMLREAEGTATWIIEDPRHPFEHCLSHSAMVAAYIAQVFEVVDLAAPRMHVAGAPRPLAAPAPLPPPSTERGQPPHSASPDVTGLSAALGPSKKSPKWKKR
jgi:hypothetical protein